jgi:hypothetical protein
MTMVIGLKPKLEVGQGQGRLIEEMQLLKIELKAEVKVKVNVHKYTILI